MPGSVSMTRREPGSFIFAHPMDRRGYLGLTPLLVRPFLLLILEAYLVKVGSL